MYFLFKNVFTTAIIQRQPIYKNLETMVTLSIEKLKYDYVTKEFQRLLMNKNIQKTLCGVCKLNLLLRKRPDPK